jgi:hypothetical protein
LPLKAACATTVHAAQGRNVAHHVAQPPTRRMGKNVSHAAKLTYVQLSRCCTLAGTHLLSTLSPAHFTSYADTVHRVHAEYARLRALPPPHADDRDEDEPDAH